MFRFENFGYQDIPHQQLMCVIWHTEGGSGGRVKEEEEEEREERVPVQ